jgi:hypothetical protein
MAYTVTTDLGSQTLAELDGLHNESQTTLDDLKNILEAIQTTITGMSTDGGNKMSKDVGGKVKKTVGNEDAKGGGTDGPAVDKQPAKIGADIGLNDLNGLSKGSVMGALLVNSTLIKLSADLFSRLDQIIQQMPTGKNAAKVAKENAKAAGKNKTVNKVDPKAFKDLAESLKIFAKAAVIMAIIPFPIVKMATKSFGYFIDKMVDCANEMGPNLKEFKKFSEGIQTIVNCLKTYAIAVILLALTLPLAPFALLNVMIMRVMIRVLGTVAEIATSLQPVLNDMVMAFVKIGVAMILYGVAMMIIVQVGKQALDALKGLLIMITFLGALAILGFLCTYLILALAPAMVAFIQLSVAMILFGIALKIMEKIKVDQKQIDNVMLAIKTIATGFSAMMGVILGALLSIIGFTVFSLLFVVSILVFNIGLLLLKLTDIILGLFEYTDGGGLVVIERIKDIVKQFAGKEVIGTFLLGMVAMIPFLVFSALFFVGVLLFTLGAVFLLVTDIILDKITDKDTGKNRPITYMIEIAKDMAASAGWWLLGSVAMIPALVFVVELAVFAGLAAISATLLNVTKKELDKMGSLKDINAMGDKLREAGIGVMMGFLGLKHEPGEGIGLGDLLKGGKNAIKMAALGAEAVLAIAPMALFMIAAKQIGEAFVSLEQSMESVKPETIEKVFGGLSMVLGSLASVAYALKDSSAETIEAIGGLVKNVAEAINLITDIVIKLKDGIPDEQIDAATTAMLHICERLFGRPGEAPEDGRYTLCTTLESIASADLQDLNVQAVEAIAPLMEGIDRMSDLVIKLADPETFNEEKITQGVTNLGYFLAAMKDVSTAMMGLIKKEATGEVIAGKHFWNKDQPVYKSPLDAIQEVVDSGFFSTFNSVMNGMQNIGNRMQSFDVTGLQNFADFIGSQAMLTFGNSAENFQKGFEKVSKGLSNLNEKMLNNFEKFINIVNNASGDSFKNAVNNLIRLGSAASKFERIAAAMSSMADSLTKMAKKKKDIVNIFEAIGDTKTDKIESVAPTNAAASVGGTTINPYVEKIYDVLMDWNENGIPVKAQIDNETGEISPVEANNSVGLGKGRK